MGFSCYYVYFCILTFVCNKQIQQFIAAIFEGKMWGRRGPCQGQHCWLTRLVMRVSLWVTLLYYWGHKEIQSLQWKLLLQGFVWNHNPSCHMPSCFVCGMKLRNLVTVPSIKNYSHLTSKDVGYFNAFWNIKSVKLLFKNS